MSRTVCFCQGLSFQCAIRVKITNELLIRHFFKAIENKRIQKQKRELSNALGIDDTEDTLSRTKRYLISERSVRESQSW